MSKKLGIVGESRPLETVEVFDGRPYQSNMASDGPVYFKSRKEKSVRCILIDFDL